MCNKQPIKVFPQQVKNPKQNKNAAAYYQCLLNESLNGFNGQRITQACRNCKLNGANLAQEQQEKINTLLITYQQFGQSLRAFLTLLTPLEPNATN